jgi:hypothetical protein
MAVTTRLATPWAARSLIVSGLCVVFSLWGMYDLLVKIPREEDRVRRYRELREQWDVLEGKAALTPEELQQAQRLDADLQSFGGATPEPPAAYDRLVCWAFILCIAVVPFTLGQYLSARRKVYRLEDDGTLVTPEGTWPAGQIAGIDMSRWMSKSVAFVVLRDGRRVKLDDHIHRNTHLIVGEMAHRAHPEAWDREAHPLGAAPSAAADPGAEGRAATAAGQEGSAEP